LFLIAVVPGAPLMTRGAAQKGFDPLGGESKRT
jgi:hypothetical protein